MTVTEQKCLGSRFDICCVFHERVNSGIEFRHSLIARLKRQARHLQFEVAHQLGCEPKFLSQRNDNSVNIGLVLHAYCRRLIPTLLIEQWMSPCDSYLGDAISCLHHVARQSEYGFVHRRNAARNRAPHKTLVLAVFRREGTDMDEPSGITNSYRRRATMCREQAAMTPTLCNRAVFLSQADGYEHFADIAESHAEDQSLHDDGLCEG